MSPAFKQTVKELLRKHNIRPSKRLGQNFLIDKDVLKKIIEAAELPASPPASPNRGESQGWKPDDIVLEIGPGLGILTLELAKRVKQVIAIEKDRTLCQILENILKSKGINNVKVINKDVLKIASSMLVSRGLKNYKVVANLPYYITSPVIRKFLECNETRQRYMRYMVLMVQKEVAQRIVARPPKMNLLAVAVQFYAQPKIIDYVSKNSFWPQPKVDSAIIKIIPKPIVNS